MESTASSTPVPVSPQSLATAFASVPDPAGSRASGIRCPLFWP
ncbi:MAG: hypothetical protein ACR2OE_11050 [Thermomicrobiales bacterium]